VTGGSALTFPERPEGLPDAPVRDPRPWRATLAIPIALGAVIVSLVTYALAAAVRSGLVTTPTHRAGDAGVAAHGAPPVLSLVATFAQDLGLIVGVGLAVAFAFGGRPRLDALGLRPTRVLPAIGYVVAGYAVFLLVSAAWTSGLGITDRENIPIDLGTRDSTASLVAAIFLVCAVAPLAEELFFRGFLFGALRKRGLPVAAGVTGLLFGLAHVASAPVGFIVPLALLGVILCLLYERTKSLYPSIALHCLNNSIAFGAGDGRGWLVPICLVGSGAALFLILRAIDRIFGGERRLAVA
jgi:membrane protease YdiL (CAAX protease family)